MPEEPLVTNQQWQLDETSNMPVESSSSDVGAVSWTASEFISHAKSPSWYLFLGFGAVVLGIATYLVAHDISSVVVVVMAIGVLGVVGARQPRTLQYSISSDGLRIGQKNYLFDDFKSFSIMEDGAIDSILLTPLKRFMPPITMYFSPDDGEKIIGSLAEYLPHEEKNADLVDRLMSRIHF